MYKHFSTLFDCFFLYSIVNKILNSLVFNEKKIKSQHLNPNHQNINNNKNIKMMIIIMKRNRMSKIIVIIILMKRIKIIMIRMNNKMVILLRF